jgi:hypothetical protein
MPEGPDDGDEDGRYQHVSLSAFTSSLIVLDNWRADGKTVDEVIPPARVTATDTKSPQLTAAGRAGAIAGAFVR